MNMHIAVPIVKSCSGVSTSILKKIRDVQYVN